MTTHRNLAKVCTSVSVPAKGSPARWEPCPELPPVLGDHIVRSCEDLAVTVAAQGNVVAHLLVAHRSYSAFRLVARYTDTGQLAAWVEWVREPASGVWVQHDEPMTACTYGVHGAGATVHQLGTAPRCAFAA